MTIAVGRIALPGGLALPYVEQGDPAGFPVILLHGVTDSWRSFERVLPHLPGSIHALALTQRGHGDADRPQAGYRTRDFAADVAAVADALLARIPGSRLLVYEGAGHGLHWEEPVRFAGDLAVFVGGVAASAAGP